jgi:hypothetical protein
MRKRKYVIGSLALAAVVCFAAVAQAAVTSQDVFWAPDPTPPKQSKKKPKGGVGLGVGVRANYDNLSQTSGPGAPSAHAELAVIHFDKDFAFNAGTLPTCAKAAIQTATTDQAKAACPGAIVGSGDAHLNGALGPATGVVTAFNGVPSGGQQVIELHARVGPPLNSTQVLTGTLQPSTKAGQGFGKQLVVPVAPLGGGAQVILDFSTALPKLVSKKGGKAAKKGKKGKKKKKKPPTYFISGNCSDKTWNIEGDFTFVDSPGGAAEPTVVLTGRDTAPCKQKPVKKKKKKK